MSSQAQKFIQNRTNRFAITQKRVNDICSYIFNCYCQVLSDNKQYSRNWVKANTTDKFENFIKKRLVHDYLKTQKNKYLPDSSLEDIQFECEPEMPYSYFNQLKGKSIEANDRIDIKINRLALQEIWKSTHEQDIYLAVECKILKKLSDNTQYENDIQKFCDREHLQFRLPIEGMIAFKESATLSTRDFVSDINKRLKNSNKIKTTRLLRKAPLTLPDYYSSSHKRNFGSKADFSVAHLYLDYSTIITT